MKLDLAGSRAFVTASSGGIGLAIARSFADEGCAVLLHGRDRGRLATVAKELAAATEEVDVVVGDLVDPVASKSVAATAQAWGADILVNNVGPFSEHSWADVTLEDWATAFDGNVATVAQMTKALLPSLVDNGWGRVINIGARATVTPLANMVEYSAAKAAVVNMTTSLAKHLAHSGVTANAVSPGVIQTEGLSAMFRQRLATEEPIGDENERLSQMARDYAPNPSGRLGTPEDIAAAVTFLASPLAGCINGINLRVDGGITGTS